MNREPTSKSSATSFNEVQQNGSLSLEVQNANWQYVRLLLDNEQTTREADQQLCNLLMEIGQAVVDDESQDQMHITRTQELQQELRRLEVQHLQIKEQMRAAMKEKLTSMLSPGQVEKIPEGRLSAFFDNLEHASHVQMGVSRMLESGLKQIKHRLEGGEDSEAE